jgi:2-polyprenyl-6-methoxyphenol hydroxylase-like FAD-dependent oxidoreductase
MGIPLEKPRVWILRCLHFLKWGWSSVGASCVSLVGDAVHTMRPTERLGCSMALTDVLVSHRHLEPSERDVREALSGLEGERAPRVAKVHANQVERCHARIEPKEVPPLTDEKRLRCCSKRSFENRAIQ